MANNLTQVQLRELDRFGKRVNKFGVNFSVCNEDGELVLSCDGPKNHSNPELLTESGLRALKQNYDCPSFEQENGILTLILKVNSEEPAFAVVLSAVEDDQQPYLNEMLVLLMENFQVHLKADEAIDTISAELSHVYEELVLLHKLGTNMRVSKPDGNFLQMACDRLTEIVLVEGIAVLLEKTIDDQKQLKIAAGSGLIDIDERKIALLHSRLEEEIQKGNDVLLDSEVDSPFRYEWTQGTKNIIAVPLFAKDKTNAGNEEIHSEHRIIGLMVAVNRVDKPDFDSRDAKLFNSVASDCAVFVENGRLFNDLKELFIGSLKALTSSIDAKDQYTHGHSERVAFISRWIAEKLVGHMPITEEEINTVYLAGLLHDIGKIGVDGNLLRKTGKLDEQELKRIRSHPMIGANILGQIKQMNDVMAGVLCHHERIDGKGYPRGLSGEQIPLIGRIVGLADTFDAMTSDRSYRNAMPLELALEEIEKGLGTQFDQEIGTIFINSDVYQLHKMMSQKSGYSIIGSNRESVEYGAMAVGTLIE